MYACSGINIHVAVVKTGLPGDQTLLTVEGSMRSSAAHQLQPQEGGWEGWWWFALLLCRDVRTKCGGCVVIKN